jgi:heat shock protein HslJ
VQSAFVRRLAVAACVVTGSSVAAAQPLICFGNEPSWSVAFDSPDRARVSTPDGASTEYQGKETRIEPLRERLWRGRGAAGNDLVVFLRDTACSDGMSDTKHPVTVSVSMPNGAFLAGCCRIPAGQTESTALEGATWRLVDLPGQAPATLAKLERGLTARFEAGRVTGFAGCNTFMGTYTLKENRLTVGALAGTMMACPEPAMTLERAFHAGMGGMGGMKGPFSYTITGNRLSLKADSGAVLAFEKEAPPTLAGGSWEVTGYNNGRQAVISPATGTKMTVAFEKGTITGQSGCNTFRAPYSTEGNRIKVGPAVTTRMMCGESVMTEEREFLKALESATTWTIDAGLLHLHRPDGERVLVAGPRR